MMKFTRRDLFAASAILAAPALGRAQAAYPNRPVRFVVPFPPGNMSDLISRLMVDEMANRGGVQIVVDNRAGATGAIGIQAVSRSTPDGYTLLMSSNSPLVVNPAVTRNLPFDVTKDLVPIGLVGWTTFLIVVPPDFPANTLAEAIALFRANPTRYIACNPGAGTFGNLVTEQIFSAVGIKMEQVPYRGSAQALLDMQQGRVHFMVDAMTSALPQVQGKAVKALAVLANRRSPLAPEIPTLAESGMPDLAPLESMAWSGLLGPVGTPPEVISFWNRAITAMQNDAALVRRFASINVEMAPPSPPEKLGEMVRTELARWTRVAQEANITVGG